MNRHERRARAAQAGKQQKQFSVAISKLPNMVDAVFVGNHDKPGGWVIMEVNAKGRSCVDALFPDAHIAWGDPGDVMPADWHGFEINLPDVVSAMPTKLPLEITKGADLDVANPDALALLLAIGVTRQGGRSAILRDGHLDIFHGKNQ
jgi:hypothetical protein